MVLKLVGFPDSYRANATVELLSGLRIAGVPWSTQMPSTSRQDPNPVQIGIGDQTLADVKEMLCRALEMPYSSLAGNEALADLRAWDSLAVLNLMVGIDARYGITLSAETILACDTVRDLAMLVSRRRESG